MDEQFGGQIQKIQWNNNLKSLWLSFYFIFGIIFYVTLLLTAVLLVIAALAYAVDPQNFTNELRGFELKPNNIYRIGKPYVKMFVFVILATMWFFKQSLGDVGYFFSAQRLELPHDDPFYKTLENLCIERGLRVPHLYLWHENIFPEECVTGAVVQDLRKGASLVITPATYHLPDEEMEAFLAQVVYRIESRDVLFLSLLCFFGFFPDHLRAGTHKTLAKILTPFLKITDMVLKPVRNMILNMRFGRSEVGAITLTKKKAPMAALLEKLAPLETVRLYFHDQYLPLFITKTNEEYRKALIKKA
ncbi:MAG: hypothetical protein R3E13_07380 [Alphaproteobacteria bacterium]